MLKHIRFTGGEPRPTPGEYFAGVRLDRWDGVGRRQCAWDGVDFPANLRDLPATVVFHTAQCRKNMVANFEWIRDKDGDGRHEWAAAKAIEYAGYDDIPTYVRSHR